MDLHSNLEHILDSMQKSDVNELEFSEKSMYLNIKFPADIIDTDDSVGNAHPGVPIFKETVSEKSSDKGIEVISKYVGLLELSSVVSLKPINVDQGDVIAKVSLGATTGVLIHILSPLGPASAGTHS